VTLRSPAPRAEQSAPPIRIVVADDHALDRAGIVNLLQSQEAFEVVGETWTVEDSIERCRVLQPDVFVLALKLCFQDHEAAIPAIRSQLPELRILALSERSAEHCLVLNPPWRKWLSEMSVGAPPVGMDCLQMAAHQGAMATLRRSADPQDLFLAVRLVAQGQACYDPMTATGILAETGGKRAGVGRSHPLSDREMEVAALLVEAHSNKEIALLLGIREPTVKKHVRHILDKLGLEDRLQAGLFLARNPLLLEP